MVLSVAHPTFYFGLWSWSRRSHYSWTNLMLGGGHDTWQGDHVFKGVALELEMERDQKPHAIVRERSREEERVFPQMWKQIHFLDFNALLESLLSYFVSSCHQVVTRCVHIWLMFLCCHTLWMWTLFSSVYFYLCLLCIYFQSLMLSIVSWPVFVVALNGYFVLLRLPAISLHVIMDVCGCF